MLRAFTIFLIDDDEDDHEFFQMAIEKIDPVLKCEFARDGMLGLEKLRDPLGKPDIIFLDINMPQMNGIDCLREIKKIEHLKDVPVYMYSTSDDYSITQSCIKHGAVGTIKKLSSIERLRLKLVQVFSELKTFVLNA